MRIFGSEEWDSTQPHKLASAGSTPAPAPISVSNRLCGYKRECSKVGRFHDKEKRRVRFPLYANTSFHSGTDPFNGMDEALNRGISEQTGERVPIRGQEPGASHYPFSVPFESFWTQTKAAVQVQPSDVGRGTEALCSGIAITRHFYPRLLLGPAGSMSVPCALTPEQSPCCGEPIQGSSRASSDLCLWSVLGSYLAMTRSTSIYGL